MTLTEPVSSERALPELDNPTKKAFQEVDPQNINLKKENIDFQKNDQEVVFDGDYSKITTEDLTGKNNTQLLYICTKMIIEMNMKNVETEDLEKILLAKENTLIELDERIQNQEEIFASDILKKNNDLKELRETLAQKEKIIVNLNDAIERKNSVIRKFSVSTKNVSALSEEVVNVLKTKKSMRNKMTKNRKVRSVTMLSEVMTIAESIRSMVITK